MAKSGAIFSVWAAQCARSVSIVAQLQRMGSQRIALQPPRFIGNLGRLAFLGADRGALYKFHIESQRHGYHIDKADPLGLMHEKPPRTASVVWDLDYQWNDHDWMQKRVERNSLRAPQSVYEVHLGSWMRVPEEHNRPLTYRETAPRLAQYVGQLGFTHVEFLPVMEHPFYGSWGYQTTGYFVAHIALRHAAGLYAPRRISRTSTASASFSIGSHRTSLPTLMASLISSTERISTSTPTRARDFILTGRRTFLIMAALKSAAS